MQSPILFASERLVQLALPALHHLHYTRGLRFQIYRLSSAVQLSTTVIGDVLASSSGVLTRKRWPSGVTAYGYRPTISRV